MKKILAALTLAFASLGVVAIPTAAHAYSQVCVADPHDPQLIHTPYVEGDGGDDAAVLGGMIVRPFPQNAYGCASYDGTPLQEWETLYPGEHTHTAQAATCAPTTVVDTQRVDELTAELAVTKAKVDRQRAAIARLRAKLHAQR